MKAVSRASAAAQNRAADGSGKARLRSSIPLYDFLAAQYEEHFAVPHRQAYDELAWQLVKELLHEAPVDGGPVVDAGCGVGRWARRLSAEGFMVIGVEQAPAMLEQVRRKPHRLTRVVEGSIETLDAETVLGRDSEGAQLVLAMGSVQYTQDPESTIRNLVSWLHPGGVLAVLVDSLVGLVLELIGAGREAEAAERLATERGVWRVGRYEADLHLLDRKRLVAAFSAAGLTEITASGLLVSAAALGKERLQERLNADYQGCLAGERRWAADPRLADVGKQLLVTGRLPR